MATRIDKLLDKNENVVLPVTRTKAVYDDDNNRLDNLLSGLSPLIGAAKGMGAIASTKYSVTVDLSSYIKTGSYYYHIAAYSTTDGTNTAIPIVCSLNHQTGEATFARSSGSSIVTEISFEYILLEIPFKTL